MNDTDDTLIVDAQDYGRRIMNMARDEKIDARTFVLGLAMAIHATTSQLRSLLGQPPNAARHTLGEVGGVVDAIERGLAPPEEVAIHDLDPNTPADIEGNPV